MPRTYSEPFLIGLHKENPHRTGIALALACVKANLPAKYVAEALEVSRMTVFGWFRGKPIRHKNMLDRKSTRLNSSHVSESRMPSSA